MPSLGLTLDSKTPAPNSRNYLPMASSPAMVLYLRDQRLREARWYSQECVVHGQKSCRLNPSIISGWGPTKAEVTLEAGWWDHPLNSETNTAAAGGQPGTALCLGHTKIKARRGFLDPYLGGSGV